MYRENTVKYSSLKCEIWKFNLDCTLLTPNLILKAFFVFTGASHNSVGSLLAGKSFDNSGDAWRVQLEVENAS